MADTALDTFSSGARTDWIRLRTLIVLRWIVIAAQLIAITLAHRFFQIELELGLCYLAVGAAVIANLTSVFAFPENKRLSEREVAIMLAFDILQLSFLIYLTGGLNNPFALMILIPVTISASALTLRSTLTLGTAAIVLISFSGVFHVSLHQSDGQVIALRNHDAKHW